MWLLRNKIFIASVCILIALFFAFIVTPKYQNYVNKTVDIVVVNENITANTLITESMITTKSMHFSDVPKNAIMEQQQVIGKYSRVPMFCDDFITIEKIATNKIEKDYLNNLDSNMTAVAVTMTSLSASLAGQIRPGDDVSIVAYDKRNGTMLIPKELELITIADVINDEGFSIYKSRESALDMVTAAVNKDEMIPGSVVLMCSLEQSLKLVELENMGRIHLIYRGTSSNSRKKEVFTP